ncbi:hypothetical protein D9757_008918 [Collybiopsis confluens]|uniref:Uncharacterized protein n=1 Tax=Collybiopsis confluens TaxID=2823264 RepID=A0A8H5H566_9AGAR|nr:hypothetical protein D9757_008918 [Collybiopsis confluens]
MVKVEISGFEGRAGQWVSNQTNKFKNAFSMLRIITQQSLPGIDIYAMGFFNLFRTPFQICSASSTKPNSWTAPMRRILLDSYIELQQGLAKNDKKTITKLTEVPYFNEALKLLKKTSSSSSSSSSPTPFNGHSIAKYHQPRSSPSALSKVTSALYPRRMGIDWSYTR